MRTILCLLLLMSVAKAQDQQDRPRRVSCATVRWIVEQLGEEGAKALGKSFNMTPEEEEMGRKCLPRKKPKEK